MSMLRVVAIIPTTLFHESVEWAGPESTRSRHAVDRRPERVQPSVLGGDPHAADAMRTAAGSQATASRRLLFIQGGGSGAHAYDAPLPSRLHEELGPGWTVDYPTLSGEEDPSVASWGPQLDRLIREVDPRSVVVAHSIGATVLVNTLIARVPIAHADLYARAIPSAVVRRIEGADHQLNGDLSVVAPDIRALVEAQ